MIRTYAIANCDANPEHHVKLEGCPTEFLAEAKLRLNGWKVVDGLHVCPPCAFRTAAAEDEAEAEAPKLEGLDIHEHCGRRLDGYSPAHCPDPGAHRRRS